MLSSRKRRTRRTWLNAWRTTPMPGRWHYSTRSRRRATRGRIRRSPAGSATSASGLRVRRAPRPRGDLRDRSVRIDDPMRGLDLVLRGELPATCRHDNINPSNPQAGRIDVSTLSGEPHYASPRSSTNCPSGANSYRVPSIGQVKCCGMTGSDSSLAPARPTQPT